MKKPPIPFSSGNDLPLDLGKIYDFDQATGKSIEAVDGVVRVFMTATDSPENDLPTAGPIDPTLDVEAVYGTNGRWSATFDATILTPEICAAHFAGGIRVWAVIVRINSRRKARELKYEPVSYAL